MRSLLCFHCFFFTVFVMYPLLQFFSYKTPFKRIHFKVLITFKPSITWPHPIKLVCSIDTHRLTLFTPLTLKSCPYHVGPNSEPGETEPFTSLLLPFGTSYLNTSGTAQTFLCLKKLLKRIFLKVLSIFKFIS